MVRGVSAPTGENGVYSINETAKFGDVAYVPGTGPENKTCDDCLHMLHSRGAATYGRCAKAAVIRRLELDEIGYIDRWNSACKYFEARPEGVKPWDGLKRHDPDDLGDAGSDGGDGSDREGGGSGSGDELVSPSEVA